MGRKKSIDDFQPARAGRAERLRLSFPNVVNQHMKRLRFEAWAERGVPDFKVLKGDEVIAYFEAEFPDEGRWPPGDEFKYETIRWPERKRRYCQEVEGTYLGKPLFLITIRCDLQDAYYIDAKTWCQKAKEETQSGSKFYGFPKDCPDLGKGLCQIEEYILRRIEEIY